MHRPYECRTPGWGDLLSVKLACREHLCPAHGAKFLPQHVGSASEKNGELQHPVLYLATGREQSLNWDDLLTTRRELTKHLDLRWFGLDVHPVPGGWEFRPAFPAEGETRPPEGAGITLTPFSVDASVLRQALDHVFTRLEEFEANGPALRAHLETTRQRQFVQKLDKKGKRRAKGAGGLLDEVRKTLGGGTL